MSDMTAMKSYASKPAVQTNKQTKTGANTRTGSTSQKSSSKNTQLTNVGDPGPADLVSNSDLQRMSMGDLKDMISADFAGGNQEEAYNASLAWDELSRRNSSNNKA